VKYLNLISIVVGGTLLYLLSSSSTNTSVFSINYYVLLGLTGLFALSLADWSATSWYACAASSGTRFSAPGSRCAWWFFSR